MNYKIYKLAFTSGVHFGEKNLEDSGYMLHCDAIFSALCTEAVKMGDEVLKKLYDCAKSGELLLSDAFPYIDKHYFLPKPMVYIEHNKNKNQEVREKEYKKLQFVPFEYFDDYLNGTMDIGKVQKIFSQLGMSDMKVSAYLKEGEDALPYRIGVYYFNEKNGLYFIAGYENEDVLALFEDLLCGLETTGIGGRRATGLGHFSWCDDEISEDILNRISKTSDTYMTLSSSLPTESEMEKVWKGAQYRLIKRSGFVASETYAKTPQRKNDLYVCSAGSCFLEKFCGDVYDVSEYGSHSVYRYAKPIFIGLGV